MLILLHGNYASPRWWEPVRQGLPEHLPTFAPDMRCWVQDGRTTIRQMAGCLADFVATRRLKTPVIAGHSLGAMVAAQFALDYPELLRALVLINAGPPEGIPLGRLDIGRKVLWDAMRRRVMRAALDRAGIATRHPLADALLDDAVATDPAVYAAFSRAVARWNVGGGCASWPYQRS